MLVIVLGYAILDELHQGTTPGRSVDVLDLLADVMGGLFAGLVTFLFLKKEKPVDPMANRLKTD